MANDTALAPTMDLRSPKERITSFAVPGYRMLGILGEGGMGTVYSAEQESPRRQVAIKVLYARSPSALVRFQTEADAMARLDHPGIARVLEAGDADGHPFLVMEHIEGTTLDLFAQPIAVAARLALFVSICDAVQHAHIKGVIHRDLKPSNVMVRDGGRIVVLDFGVARLAADDGSTPGATRAGELVGTPIYMSPEQAQLRADQVDARSDVYTLGVMLYELACGELPYEVKGMPLPALTCVICEDPPIPLGKRVPELRGDLEAITMKALAKNPTERYQSAAALGDDVRRWLEQLPVSVRTPGALERTRRFVRRRPLAALAIGGSVLAAATFAGVVTGLWLDARAARATAEDARGRAEAARGALEARTNELTLRQARAALERDPTEAIAWLATLTSRDVDAGTAWAIADEARARGVAKDVLRAHTDEVHWVEALGDGFVSGGYDGRAIVWEPVDREATRLSPRVVLTAAHGRVHVVRPSPDGSELAIGGDDGQLHVVARDGRMLAELTGHAGDVQHLAWSADGAWLATGDDHGHVYLWPHGRAPGRELQRASSAIGTVEFAATGDALIAGDHDGSIWLWNASTGVQRATTTGADVADAWTDGVHLQAVDAEGNVHTWHVDGAKLAVDRVVATGLKCKRAVFAPGGAWVVLGGVGGAVMRVEGDAIETLWTYRVQVRSIAISPDGRLIAFASDDGALELRDRITGRQIALRGHGSRVRHLAFAHGDLLSSDSDGVIRRWALAEMPSTLIDSHGAQAERMTADAEQFAAVDSSGEVSSWRLADGGHQRVGHVDGRVTEIALANGTIVTGTAEGALAWWTRPAPVRQAIKGVVKSIAASRDRVAVATSAGPIAMFTAAGALLPALDGHPGGTDTVAFDPTGRLIASGGQDRVIRVWRRDGDGYVAAGMLDGPTGDTHFIAFSPNGELLIAAGNDGAVLAWVVRDGVVDASSRDVVARHTGAVTAIAIEPHWIASAGRDATLVRTRYEGATIGASEAAAIAAAPLALAVDDDGGVHAVTRTGTAVRWSRGEAPVIEIDHGIRDGIRLAGAPRWVLAYEDGTIVIDTLVARPLAELPAVLARATTFTLPHP